MTATPPVPGERPFSGELKTTVRVVGEQEVLAFELMCAYTGRRPYQLAADLVLAAVKEEMARPEMQRAMRAVRRFRQGLELVTTESANDGNSSGEDSPAVT